ncbi:chemotaxis protein CheD [Halobacteriovorax sp. DPLXC-1]|uniref:chemotaxis protein CheD n=1 Tax=Halobacteriovorax sp. DPLXC-1 TaxID=3110771 RepID=UPI002FF2DC07
MITKTKEYIHVRIGEIKFGEIDSILNATLGSCVGIAIVDKVNKKCGLAHCFLPEGSMKSPPDQPGKYVVDAIPYLFSKMKLMGRPKKEFDVYVAGGSNMMAQLKQKNVDHIGHLNKKKVLEILDEMRIPVKEMLNGDSFACKIFVDCDTLKVKMIRIKGAPSGSTRTRSK